MCVAMGPADFRGAIGLGVELEYGLHLMGYQNTSVSYSGPNCMLLHVPAAEISAADLLPSSHAPHALKDMAASVPGLLPVTRGLLGATRGIAKGVQIVSYGAYEIVLASSVQDIPEALAGVSADKRPRLNPRIVDWFAANRKGFSFMLACFNNELEVANHPILLRYQPSNPGRIFVPGLESHDGSPRGFGERDAHHPRDIKVVFGSLLDDTSVGWYPQVSYSDNLRELKSVLPARVVGFHDQDFGINDDYWAPIEAVRRHDTGWNMFQQMPGHFDRRLHADYIDE